jgi:chromosome segregation ATPase
MTRDNLKLYQDTYAEKMAKYGLERGIKGSDARHISTPQFYRDLFAKNEDLKEEIEVLQERKEEVNEKIWDMYDRKDEAREKFLDMDNYVRQKEKELAETKARLEQLQRQHEPYKAQEDINLLVSIFPKLSENLQIAQLCREIRLTIDTIKELFTGKEVTVTGKLHSSEHDR